MLNDDPQIPLRYSTGKEYLRSPAHYRRATRVRVDKTAFDFGNAVHARVLGTGADLVAVPEELLASNGALSTKAAKEFVEDARQQGKVALKGAVVTAVERCALAVLEHPTAAQWLRMPGASEVELAGQDPATGVLLAGRLDRLPNDQPRPIDLKTTNDATERGVRRTIAAFHYDLQAAMYRRLVELNRGGTSEPMVQIYVETEPPYAVNVFEISHPDYVEAGTQKLDFIIREHAECMAAEEWPAVSQQYQRGTRVLEPSAWYLDHALELVGIDPTEVELTL